MSKRAKPPTSNDTGVVINGVLVHPDAPFTVEQAARILNRSQVTIYRMVKNGDLKPVFQRGQGGKMTIWGKALIVASGIGK